MTGSFPKHPNDCPFYPYIAFTRTRYAQGIRLNRTMVRIIRKIGFERLNAFFEKQNGQKVIHRV